MGEFAAAVRMLDRKDRRQKDRRMFAYDAFVPDRRVLPERRCRISIHAVELEDEEVASLLEPPYEP